MSFLLTIIQEIAIFAENLIKVVSIINRILVTMAKYQRFLFYWLFAASVMALAGFKSRSVHKLPTENKVEVIAKFTPTFTPEKMEEIDQFFDKLYRYQDLNGVVLVGQKGHVLYSRCHGISNRETGDSLNMNSVFQLASVSKQFTAVSILQLYQKGLLKLSDTVASILPGFPYPDITIRQLLTHRSGLPNYHYFSENNPMLTDSVISNSVLIDELIQKNIPRYFQAGKRFQYSNTGYAVLAAIVEKKTGILFEDYLKKNIFEPLGMDHTFAYRAIQGKQYPIRTTGYLSRWRPAEDNFLDQMLGDKGVYTSAPDLFKWDQGLYSGKIINPDTLKLAFEPMGRPKNASANYGYGWRMFDWGKDHQKILFHGGWWHGYKTMLVHIPQDTTTIIVLKNRSAGARFGVKDLVNILYPDSTHFSPRPYRKADIDTIEFEAKIDSMPILDSAPEEVVQTDSLDFEGGFGM